MDEQVVNTKCKRKPIIAAIFSWFVPGLGHIYCGRIVKGLLTSFIWAIFIPIVTFTILAQLSRINTTVIWVSILISLLIWLISIIDSYRIARNTKLDYELKEYNRWYVYLIFMFIITTCAKHIALDFKSNIMEAFRTPTLSMLPTIDYHDSFLANKIAYKNDEPKRGDVIVFISPENRHETHVKRIVAVAGDTVKMDSNELYINGKKLERENCGRAAYIGKDSIKEDVKIEGELFIEKNDQAEYMIFLADTYNFKAFPVEHGADFPETKVTKNHCFVLGDSRNLSMDSRRFGAVPLATVKGRAEYLYWPVKDWSRFGPIK